VPRSPYFPVEYAAGQERGPSPMVMERFQSVVSQLFQHVRGYQIFSPQPQVLGFLLRGFFECNVLLLTVCLCSDAEDYPMWWPRGG
jgi:hypothetical protein